MIYIEKLTHIVLRILIVVLAIILIYSVLEFVLITLRTLVLSNGAFSLSAEPLNRDRLLLSQVQGLISALFMIIIVMELINSLVAYLKVGSENYVGVIFEIALIAIVRHLLALGFEHIEQEIYLGLSSLILVLGIFYMLLYKNNNILSMFRNRASKTKAVNTD